VVAGLEDACGSGGGEDYIHAELVLINLLSKMSGEVLEAGRRWRDHRKNEGAERPYSSPRK
jgi:hypothetical protein